jgi:hypothetical protein
MSLRLASSQYGTFNVRQVTKAQIEIVAETVATLPVLILNKSVFPLGRTRYVRFGKGVTAYHFKKDKEKVQTATITDYVTVTNPTQDRDFNDDTYASYTVSAGATQDIRLYDFGTVATRFVFLKIGSATSGIYSRLYASSDGSTWTLLAQKDATATTYLMKASFRYLKWQGYNTTSTGYGVILYTLEVFDPNDRTAMSNTGELVVVGYGDIGWVILDGSGSCAYYVYDISDAKVTDTQYVLVVA